MAANTIDALYDKAGELAPDARGDGRQLAVEHLLNAAGGDIAALEAARDRYVARLHGHSDDWAATAALTLLNRTLSTVGKVDPFDWKERWDRHRKP